MFADFSAAPWQGFEKSERCPNNSSLFQPLAVVVVVALGCLLPRLRRGRAVRVLYRHHEKSPQTEWSASFLVDIPTRWEPRAKQSRTVALLTALCAAALFEPCTVHHKTAVIPIDIPMRWEPRAKQQPTGLIAYSASQSRPVRVLYRPAPTWVSG